MPDALSMAWGGLLLAESAYAPSAAALVSHPAGILAVLLSVLAAIFWLSDHPVFGRLFRVIPALVFCYFVPTALTTSGVIPSESPLYSWTKTFVLPAALLLLILALDLPAIARLGPKALLLMLTGTLGVVIGGPVAFWFWHPYLPEDAWRGMAALCGSWIGGGANYVAIGQVAKASDKMMATMVIPDVFVANVWMGCLLYAAGQQTSIDRWLRADASAIRELEAHMTDFQQRVARIPTLKDLLAIVALGFAVSYACYEAGRALPKLGDFVDATAWRYILVTTVGVALSFTPARRLEGAGASKLGSVLLYLLVACIGASADFRLILEAPALIGMGFTWIAVHIVLLVTVGILARAPVFLIAVGSQSNIGGAASAPVVAAAFHPSLAPVGVLLAILGYVLGTYCGLVVMRVLMGMAGDSL